MVGFWQIIFLKIVSIFVRSFGLRNLKTSPFLAGAPYKVCMLVEIQLSYLLVQYVAGTDNTVPFDRAPEVVRDALQLIKDRVAKVVEDGVNFNEILTAAYMEEQSMSVSSLVE